MTMALRIVVRLYCRRDGITLALFASSFLFFGSSFPLTALLLVL